MQFFVYNTTEPRYLFLPVFRCQKIIIIVIVISYQLRKYTLVVYLIIYKYRMNSLFCYRVRHAHSAEKSLLSCRFYEIKNVANSAKHMNIIITEFILMYSIKIKDNN